VVLYELLSGRTPFAGESCQEILQAVLTHEPVPLDLLEVDPDLAALIHWGLSKDRDARPASLWQLGRELAAWLFARGVLEDATGASLDAKWLGRGNETTSLGADHDPNSPRAQHDHATLVSVVHPSPRPEHISIAEPRLPKRRQWLPSALVAGVALAGGLGWVSLTQLASGGPVMGTASPDEPAHALAAPVAATVAPADAPPPRVEAVTIEQLPVEPAPPAAAPKQPAAPKPYVAAIARSTPAIAAPANMPVTLRATAGVAPRSLPQALPPSTKQVELLDPY
jgi:hypothetical protein